MDPLKEIIVPRMEQKDSIFVFPSEVAARFMQKKALCLVSGTTSANNRFISWDQFKEQTLRYGTHKTAVNSCLRRLFTEQILAENKKRPFLKALIRPCFADNSQAYVNSICSFLPLLHKIEHISKAGFKNDIIDKKRLADLGVLLTRYKTFLQRNMLYEPLYETPSFEAGGRTYLIYYPEIIKDFDNVSRVFSASSAVTLIPLPEDSSPHKAELLVFPTTITEVKWFLLKIAELVDSGINPSEIVLTVPGIEKLESYLKEQATLLSLELDFHQGKPISSYPGVGFLNTLQNIYASGFSLDEIKSLIWNCALPWKHKTQARELVRFGITYNCLKNYYEDEQERDIWHTHLKRLTRSREYSEQKLKDLTCFYSLLKKNITAICTARNFKKLEQAVREFCSAFFIEGMAGGEIAGFFEYAFNILRELTLNAERADLPAPDSAFNLWLSILRERKYVPQSRKKGIPVYPYRVSAGIRPKYHFIINASQAHTEYIVKKYPFLHINEEAHLPESDLDLSDPFLALYTHSGEQTFVSFARKDFTDSHLPPAFFISNGVISEYSSENFIRNTDPLLKERALWNSGTENSLFTLTPLQKKGFLSAHASVLQTRSSDYTKSFIKEKSILKAIIGKLPHEEGKLRISPTSLELFTQCPFCFLLTEALEIASVDYEQEFLNPLWAGVIIHRVLYHFFNTLLEHDEIFDPDNLDRYQKDIMKSISIIENYFGKSEAVPLKPVWAYFLQNLKDKAVQFLSLEAEAFPFYKAKYLEHTVGVDWEDRNLALRGKIDRVCEKDNKYIIIDYKKKTTPKKQDIFPVGCDPISYQMPFYFYLLTESGFTITSASYYSFENCGFTHVFNPHAAHAVGGAEELESALEILKKNVIAMTERIRSGEFTIRMHNNNTQCSHCDFRSVCRMRFVLA